MYAFSSNVSSKEFLYTDKLPNVSTTQVNRFVIARLLYGQSSKHLLFRLFFVERLLNSAGAKNSRRTANKECECQTSSRFIFLKHIHDASGRPVSVERYDCLSNRNKPSEWPFNGIFHHQHNKRSSFINGNYLMNLYLAELQWPTPNRTANRTACTSSLWVFATTSVRCWPNKMYPNEFFFAWLRLASDFGDWGAHRIIN